MSEYAPHVIQPSASHPLLCSLDNLNALDIGTKHLDPHLDSHPRQRISQETCRVCSTQSDAQNNPGERIAVLEQDSNDVSDVDAAAASPVVEQLHSFAGWIEERQLALDHGCDGVFAYCGCGWGSGIDLDLLGFCPQLES